LEIFGDEVKMNNSHFFAMLSRMKYINRWGLMNNTNTENISEHSLQVAMFTHCMILMHNEMYGENLNAEHGAMLALYHDTSEIITGDMPTPVKYYNPDIIDAYKKVEKIAQDKLISLLPEGLQKYYDNIIHFKPEDEVLWKYVKVGDKISAIAKCVEEIKMGNKEFTDAYKTLTKAVEDMKMPVADKFVEEFIPSFNLTLDRLK
jgi:5'-deoxynucleotidase